MDLWNFILWLIFGGVAGWIASMIMGTNAQQGWVMNVIVGIIGAFLGGFLVNLIPGMTAPAGINFLSLITAVIGAVVLLFIYRLVTKRGT